MSILPLPGISLGVEDGEHHYALLILDIEDRVGETAQQGTAHAAMHVRKLPGRAQQRLEHGLHVQQKIVSQTSDSLFIPIKGGGQFRFRFGSDDEPTAHLRPRMRSRTLSHGEPASGCW